MWICEGNQIWFSAWQSDLLHGHWPSLLSQSLIIGYTIGTILLALALHATIVNSLLNDLSGGEKRFQGNTNRKRSIKDGVGFRPHSLACVVLSHSDLSATTGGWWYINETVDLINKINITHSSWGKFNEPQNWLNYQGDRMVCWECETEYDNPGSKLYKNLKDD